MHYSYDALDRVSEICYNDNESIQHKYIYTYTASGAVHSLECTESGRKYQYSYNSRGQLIGYTELAVRENAYTDLSQSFFWYDDLNRLDYAQTTFRYAVGDTNYLSEADYYDAVGYGYTYDNSASGRDGSGVGALTELEIFGGGLHHGATISYGYDSMYRLTEKTTTANENAGFSQTVSYGYRQLGSGRTTGQVSSYRSEVNGTATAYTYTYDSNGNITRITDQSGKVTRYTYDKLGQLTREDNPYLNKTYVYTYNNAGNRLSKKTYAYTTGTPGNATATESYNYTGDRLTQVGSIVYQYDAIGNPTTYNGYTLEWNGRKLMEMSMNVGQFLYTFAYNADGIRTVKTNGSTIHHYTLNGSQIVTETWTTKSSSGAETPNHFLVYLYDENGAPVGLQYRNKTYGTYTFDTYYFEKNLQGDIIAIYTENGTKIGSYTYDAWGNCTISTESGTTTIQKRIVRTLNPFRYRGYYYDTETGLYYVSSRYYDPRIGRWISPEPNVYEGEFDKNAGLIGYNVYAYCANNPVNNLDPTGEFVISTAVLIGIGIGAAIGGVVGGTYGYKKAVRNNVPKGQRWKYVVGYGIGGAVVGGVIGGFVGYGAGVALGVKASSGLVMKSISKAISSVSRNTMHHIMQSKHAWGRVLRNASWNNVKGLINTTMQKGATTLIDKQGKALVYEAVRNNVVVRYAVIDGVIKISDAWVKTR